MDLNKLYDITCKTLTVTREEFVNKPEYEELRRKTLTRYKVLQDIKKELFVRRRTKLFEKCIKEEFGMFNYNEQTEYKYFIRRFEELKNVNDHVTNNEILNYLTQNKQERLKTKQEMIIRKNQEYKKIISEMFDKIFYTYSIDKNELLDFNNSKYEFERNQIISIYKNLDSLKNIFNSDNHKTKEVTDVIKKNMEEENLEVSFENFLRFIFINARKYNEIKQKFNVNLINPTIKNDMLALVYNSKLVEDAHSCTKKDNITDVLNAYQKLKNNEAFLELFNNKKEDKLTLGMIIKLSNTIDDLKDLNKYLGIFEKQNIENYIFLPQEKILNLKQKAVLKYSEKLLTSNKKNFYTLLENNELYNKLTDEDKEKIKNDKRLIEEFVTISQKSVKKDELISTTLNQTITRFIELYIIGLKYDTSNFNREDYYMNKDKYTFYQMSVDSYEFDIQTRKLEEQLRKQEEEKQEEMRRLQEINDRFNQQMEETNRRTNERIAEYVRDTYDRFMEMQRQENYTKWFNETFKQIREEHEEIEFDELINTFRTVINAVEQKTGKKYDPEEYLITKEMLYKFHNMQQDEKDNFVEKLDIKSLQTESDKKHS